MLFYNLCLCAAIITVIYLAAYVLVKSDNIKRNWYIAALFCVFLFLLGDLLGKISVTLEGAFYGTKVEYLGSATLTTAILLFVADMCGFKINRLLKISLWIIPFSVIILLWTTEYHGLIYSDISFYGSGLKHLQFKAGPLHLVVHIYSLLTSLAALAVLIRSFIKGGTDTLRRLNLSLLITGITVPLLVNVLYVLKIIPFNATPVFLSVSCVVFYLNTVKFDVLEVKKLRKRIEEYNRKFEINSDDLFAAEQNTYNDAVEYAAQLRGGAEIDYDRIDRLIKEYARLLRQLRRATKISDRATGNLHTHREDLQGKVNYDALTGIYNRRYLDENLKRVVKSQARAGSDLCVMMMDIDYFKKYNDTYGHSEGDVCLKNVAGAIAGCLSRPDDFAVRYGGEEFAVILPNVSRDGACIMAEKILEAVRAKNIPHEKNEAAGCVTVSIGLTSAVAEQGHTADAFIKRADEALYQSKQEGRNRYTYFEFDR